MNRKILIVTGIFLIAAAGCKRKKDEGGGSETQSGSGAFEGLWDYNKYGKADLAFEKYRQENPGASDAVVAKQKEYQKAKKEAALKAGQETVDAVLNGRQALTVGGRIAAGMGLSPLGLTLGGLAAAGIVAWNEIGWWLEKKLNWKSEKPPEVEDPAEVDKRAKQVGDPRSPDFIGPPEKGDLPYGESSGRHVENAGRPAPSSLALAEADNISVQSETHVDERYLKFVEDYKNKYPNSSNITVWVAAMTAILEADFAFVSGGKAFSEGRVEKTMIDIAKSGAGFIRLMNELHAEALVHRANHLKRVEDGLNSLGVVQ